MGKVNIIGAGILGASAAYELTLKGYKVTIAECTNPGRATSAAAGIICPWISKRRNMAWYALAKGGAAYYPTLTNQLLNDGETSIGYKKVGALRLHNDLDKLKELESIALERQADTPEMGGIKLLDQKETEMVFPYAKDGFHALSVSGAARVDGNALRNALLNAAKKRGAVYIQGKASLTVSNKQIVGMEINSTTYPADKTIAANGVWMNDLLEPLEPTIRFQTQKGELLHLQINETSTTDMPVIMPPNNQYILPLDNGKIIVGATHQTVHGQFDPSLSVEGTHYILDQLLQMAPGLNAAEIIDYRVGFRPFTSNHLPVFGALEGYEHLLLANGLGASGLTTAPFIGKQLAKIIADEETDVPLSDYRIK